eukprot:CAMPEP_0170182584 /NCGR_PEP_ID=MMETSP0040_2-20121228/28293_1 /TAXON_ID=641309 /ORGANISM="Lotharella oceanica, Strain CCMP622" /LENGTH=341 /DNA_ID=CAMNT_0010428051 /DNA_START=181 /DNA_END=1204 /DNA_ORIENTATION=-
MYSIANAIGNPSDGSAACYTQAIMIQFFGLSSMLWTVTIAYTVDRVYLKGRSIEEAAEIKKTFHYIVWGISLLLTILPATTGNYGQSTGWCWIDVKENAEAGTAWRFVTFYIPLWLVAGYNLSVYAHVRSALNAAVEQGGENAGNIAGLQRMVYYPLVLVVCYIFGTISRIQQIFGPPVYGLVILHTIGMSSQGTLNALVYGLTPSVKRVMCGEGSKLDEPSVQNVDRMDDGLVSVGLDDAKSGDATFEPARPRIRPYPAYTCTNGSAKNSTVAADILSPVPLYVNGMPLILARYPNLNTSGDRVYNNWMNVGRVGSSASDVQWFSMSDPAGDVSKRASAW